jgi:hypothetical protein
LSPQIVALLGSWVYATGAAQVRARLDDWLADQRSALIAAEADGVVAGLAALHAMPPVRG